MITLSSTWTIFEPSDDSPGFCMVEISGKSESISAKIELSQLQGSDINSNSSRLDIALKLGEGFVKNIEKKLMQENGWGHPNERLLGPFEKVVTFAELEQLAIDDES